MRYGGSNIDTHRQKCDPYLESELTDRWCHDCHADFATSLEVIISAVQLRVAILAGRVFRWHMDDPIGSIIFSKKFPKTSAMPYLEVSFF
jgi:hypothetical protein